ncbi:hypothetical protein D3C81_1583260 [compost metagenome]
MMHMVKADVAGNPLQDLRQLIIGAPFHSGHDITPFLFMLKERILELMLYIKQPDPEKTGHEHDRQLHQQKSLPADSPDHCPIE